MKTKVFFDGFEGHVRRSLERAEKMSKGEPVEAQRIITFEDPLQMIECLTVQRMAWCRSSSRPRRSLRCASPYKVLIQGHR